MTYKITHKITAYFILYYYKRGLDIPSVMEVAGAFNVSRSTAKNRIERCYSVLPETVRLVYFVEYGCVFREPVRIGVE